VVSRYAFRLNQEESMARITVRAIRDLAPGGRVWRDGVGVRKLPGGDISWSIRYRDHRGRRCTETLGKGSHHLTYDVAREVLRQRRDRVLRLRLNTRVGCDHTVASYTIGAGAVLTPWSVKDAERLGFGPFMAWSRDHKRSWSADATRLHVGLVARLGDLPIDEVSHHDLEAVLQWLRDERGNGPSTLNRHRALWKLLFRHAIDDGVIEGDPTKRLRQLREPPPKDRYLSAHEVERLLRSAETARNPYLLPIITIALATGMRKGEILALRWDDCDRHRKTVLIRDGKTGHRTIPLPDTVDSVLTSLPRVENNPHLFPSYRGGHMRRIDDGWRAIRDLAGLPGLRIHDLRHTFGSSLADRGVPIHLIQKLMGHRCIETTMRYIHAVDTHLRSAQAEMGAMGVTSGAERVRDRFSAMLNGVKTP